MSKFFEYYVTGWFPPISIESNSSDVKTLTAIHKVTATNKAEAAKIFKQVGLLEIQEGKFINSSTVVLMSVITEKEANGYQNKNDKQYKKSKE